MAREIHNNAQQTGKNGKFGEPGNQLHPDRGELRKTGVLYDIVEIGPGRSPAITAMGSLITPATRYLGISPARPEEEDLVRKYAELGIATLDADFADLSALGDGCTARVIMRSVFGEYTGPPDLTGSSLDNTRLGLFEAFRIIQERGEIVIAEENTPEGPAQPLYTASVLLHAGFTNVRVMPCQNMENPHWRETRGKFWNLEHDHPINPKWGYIIAADRPAANPNEFEPIERTILLKKVHRALRAGEIDEETPWTTSKTYLFKKPEAREGESITIITKDATTDMDTYMKGVRDHSVQPLFSD